MSKIRNLFLFVALALFLPGCNLSDFQFDNLSKLADINPVVYRPVSRGTYLVKDYITIAGVGNTPVTKDTLILNKISYALDSLILNTSGVDSMVVIIKTINETPMKYRYVLSFATTNLDSGSKLLGAATMNSQGDVMDASKDSIEFKLDTKAIKNLSLASRFDLSISLFQPGNGTVLAAVLRNSQISFFIGFRGPIDLFKAKL
jgi:hypothetical protein